MGHLKFIYELKQSEVEFQCLKWNLKLQVIHTNNIRDH